MMIIHELFENIWVNDDSTLESIIYNQILIDYY